MTTKHEIPKAEITTAAPARMRLGDMLIHARVIDPGQLELALQHQARFGGRLGSVLVSLGYISEEELESSLGRQLGLAVSEVESIHPPSNVLKLVPERLIRRSEIIPLALDGRTLTVGMTNPFDQTALQELKFLGFNKIETRLITENTLRRFLSTHYTTALLLDEVLNESDLQRIARTAPTGRDSEEANLPPIVRLCTWLFEHSVEARASDVHIEPYETFFRIRFRVDGSLYTVLTPPLRLHSGVASRIKILAGLDIAERRKPQDGHMQLEIDGDSVHFRVSVLPTAYGEKVVVRLLKKEAHLADLGRLGFSRDQLLRLKRVAALPQGLVLVTGPTGSGKTTTVHAMLNLLNEPDVNIVTIEDPVEASIPGINHVGVQEKGGVSFASALRSILRQDPEIVFVGEMRDREVSEIAVRASLTGHLVLSTLHTNGTVQTFARLVEMGIEPYLLASCVKLVVAQRLLRRLCPKCAKVEPMPISVAASFQLTPVQVANARYRVPVGCRNCMNTGFRGRLAVYELLEPDDRLRAILRAGANEEDIFAAAREAKMTTLWEAGVNGALAGETSFEEVRQALGAEG